MIVKAHSHIGGDADWKRDLEVHVRIQGERLRRVVVWFVNVANLRTHHYGVRVLEEREEYRLGLQGLGPSRNAYCRIHRVGGLLHAEVVEARSDLKIANVAPGGHFVPNVRHLSVDEDRLAFEHPEI